MGTNRRSKEHGALPDYHEQIIESLTSGVLALDAQGVVITINEAARAFLGAGKETLHVGSRLDNVPEAGPLLEVFSEVSRSGAPVSRREITLPLPGGAQKELGLSASLLAGPAAFNGVIFLFTDLTEWRRLERAAELNRQLAALGELTAGIVHELRSPVSVISGMAELLLRKLGSDDDRRGAVEAILREAASLERTISQFLGLARPQAIHRKTCKPQDIMSRAVQFCQHHAQGKAVRLEYSCEPDLPPVYVDGERVAQAVANIVGNGVDAVPPGGLVALRVYHDADDLVFEIVDNGPGIHLQPGESLFAPFFTQKEAGTGLGLTISHRTITLHDGSITYANRSEGGARFELRIPLRAKTVG